MKELTSLGRIFAACGVPNWDEMFPGEICGKCYLIGCEKQCAALTAIGAWGSMASVTQRGAQVFSADLKKAIEAIPNRRE